MFDKIKKRCDTLLNNLKEIPLERRLILEKITEYVKSRLEKGEAVNGENLTM